MAKLAFTGTDGKPLERVLIEIMTTGMSLGANTVAERCCWISPARYDVSTLLEIRNLGGQTTCPCTLKLDETREIDLLVLTIMNNKHSGMALPI